MPNFTKNPSWKSSPSFALISVLALVSLAALTATAFLASARLERQATSSIGNTTRIEMALNSGKVCLSQVINDNSQADVGGNTHIVTYWRGGGDNDWTNELGYPFIGQTKTSGTDGRVSAIWYYCPLFSPAGVTNLDTNVIQNAMRFTNLHQGSFSNDMQAYMSSTNGTNGFANNPGLTNPKCVQIPLLGGRTSPPVGWVYINQEKRKLGSALTITSPVVRIAWFTEDLEGLIDAERMGASTLRDTGTNSEEISITNATDTNGSKIIASISTFTNARKAFISYGLLANSSVSGIANSTNARYFASGLRAWTPTDPTSPTNGALAWIPAGIPISGSSTAPKGYTNQGYTKLNLNNLVSGTPAVAVANIAAVITNNLPSYTNRAGGMEGGAYVSNIAANIVDYVDADSNPTVDTANPPAWRGCEAIAWPNEIFTRIHLEAADTKAAPGGFQYSFKYKHYLEVWNINNTNVPLNNLTISNNRSFQVRIPPLTFNLNDTNLGSISNLTMTPVAGAPATLRPGEFGMLETPTITLRTNILGSTLITNVQFQDWNQNSSVIYTTNGQEISRTKMGSLIYNKDILETAPYGVVNGVNFSTALSYAVQSTYRVPPPNLKSIGGDPRAQMFLGTWPTKGQLYVNYSSPGGLNWEFGNKGFSNGYVNARDLWPDGGSYKTNDLGANPTSYGTSPETYYTGKIGTWSTNLGLAMVRNGALSNICELGNIYDPMQWEDSSQLPTAAGGMPGLWTNLSSAAIAANTAGGRTTLRIGRPEFTRFAFTNMYGNSVPSIPNMGMSSAAFLDLFCLTNGVSTTNSGPYSMGGGKINLNTAPAPVLRALAGGIRLTKDPLLTGVGGSGTNFPIPPLMAEAFAQGVMRFRSKYPFLTPAHLCFIGTGLSWFSTWPANAVFGNTNSIALSPAPGYPSGGSARINVTAWSDQAAEEWLSKIYALSSCQSHNYRIYVVAQLVATNSSGEPNAIGPLVKKYYQIYARNGSAPASLPNTTYPGNTIYSWKPSVGVIDIYQSKY
jgi:hypothetical protein